MSIIETISNDHHFAEWCKAAKLRDSDYGHFSWEAADALQAYYEDLGEQDGINIEFDPIAWCVEWSEYIDLADAWEEVGYGTDMIEGEELAIDDNIQLWLENNTQIIILDNGRVLVHEF